MAIEIQEFECLSEFLLVQKHTRIVTIDGFDGSGKTTLGAKISRALGCFAIDLDDFVLENEAETFFEFLNQSELKEATADFLRDSKLFVVSGVMMTKVIQFQQWPDPFKIYVKKQRSEGIWHDGWDIDSEQGPSGLLTELDKELLAYHREYRPHECCDCLFQHWFDYA